MLTNVLVFVDIITYDGFKHPIRYEPQCVHVGSFHTISARPVVAAGRGNRNRKLVICLFAFLRFLLVQVMTLSKYFDWSSTLRLVTEPLRQSLMPISNLL